MTERAGDVDARRVIEELEKIVAARRHGPSARTLPDPEGSEGRPESLVAGPRHSGRMLGALLVPRGYLTEDQLQYALALQRRSGERLGEIVVRLGLIRDKDLVELLAEQFRMPTIDLNRLAIDWDVAGLVSEAEARTLGILPLRRSNEYIDVAIADPTNERATDFLARRLDAPIHLYLATRAAIDAAAERLREPTTSGSA